MCHCHQFTSKHGAFVQCGDEVFFVKKFIRYSVKPQDVRHVGSIDHIDDCAEFYKETTVGPDYDLPTTHIDESNLPLDDIFPCKHQQKRDMIIGLLVIATIVTIAMLAYKQRAHIKNILVTKK